MTGERCTTPLRPGILRPVLRSTLLKDLLRARLRSIDPASATRTADILIGEDPEVIFALASSIPAMTNSLVSALTQLALRLRGSYPPEILKSMAASIARDIDTEALRACGAAWKDLAAGLLTATPKTRAETVRELVLAAARFKAVIVDAFTGLVTEAHAAEKGIWSSFVSEVLKTIDGEKARSAALVLAEAVLDQKWGLCSWCMELIRSRAKKRLAAWKRVFA